MVNKIYTLRPEDKEKLISYACRYRSIKVAIDETNGIMNVWTTFADNTEPTSFADRFQLVVESDASPTMPTEEYQRRVEGKPI